MQRYFYFLLFLWLASCQAKKSIIEEHVTLEISTFEDSGTTKASALPVIKTESSLANYKRRFDYLLMNISAMHQSANAAVRQEIWGLYPDTVKLQERYLQKFIDDKKLVAYFEEMAEPILKPGIEIKKTFTVNELMEVGSMFFYCDALLPDTVVQSHVCIGINGIKEAQFDKDYTLLAAFCFEAIFSDFDKDFSPIDKAYSDEKKMASEKFKKDITTLDKYLLDVRLDLFKRMKSSAVLKKEFLAYYRLNAKNLAFRLSE